MNIHYQSRLKTAHKPTLLVEHSRSAPSFTVVVLRSSPHWNNQGSLRNVLILLHPSEIPTSFIWVIAGLWDLPSSLCNACIQPRERTSFRGSHHTLYERKVYLRLTQQQPRIGNACTLLEILLLENHLNLCCRGLTKGDAGYRPSWIPTPGSYSSEKCVQTTSVTHTY